MTKDTPTNIYVADFETRAGEKAIAERKTWVWAWGCCNIFEYADVTVGNSMDTFMAHISGLPNNSIIYFHNAKFDLKFVIDWLYKNAFTYADKPERTREFNTLISDTGSWYCMDVSFRRGKKVRFQDSFKKLPFKVSTIGDSFKTEYRKGAIDYVVERRPGQPLTPEEEEYVKDDVRVVGEALKIMYEQEHGRMTIGSDCLNDFIGMCGGKKRFRDYFPYLSDGEDTFVRRAYRGGWCYVHRPGHYRERGSTHDVNSLYPYSMHGSSGNAYPHGYGEYYHGKYVPDPEKPLYVQHIIAHIVVKRGHLPTVQLKNSVRFAENEYIKDSEGPIELYMTNVDLELMLEQYDVYSIEYVDGFKYAGHVGFFDGYIDKWAEVKKNNKGAMRQLAKLFLNNLYGKFGQKRDGSSKLPRYDKEAELVRYTTGPVEERKSVYVPVAAFCTAYARRYTIRAAQANYDTFIYADTDSIHCLGEPSGIWVDPKELGAWKHESDWDEAIFVRQKTYMERIVTEDGDTCEPHWEIKCAGMNQDTKDVFLEGMARGVYEPGDFRVGLEIDGYKLTPKTVNGGVILYPTKFCIKGLTG